MRTYAKMRLQVLWNAHLQIIGLKVYWNEHLQKTPGGGLPTICQDKRKGAYPSRAAAQCGVLSRTVLPGVTTALLIKGSAPEHGAQHGQQPVGHAAEGAAMGVSPGAQPMVVLPADRVVLHADPRPVIGGVAQARVAASPHQHHRLLAALAGDRRDARIGAQSVVVSFGEGLRGLGQHRGGDHTSHSGQGKDERHVTMLAGVCVRWLTGGELIQQSLDAHCELAPLLGDQAEMREQQQRMFAGGFRGSRGQQKTRRLELLDNLRWF